MLTRRDVLRLVPSPLVAGLAGCTDLVSDEDDAEFVIPKTWTTWSRVARFWSRSGNPLPIVNLGGTRQPAGKRIALVRIDPETGDHVWEADEDHELASVAGPGLTVSLPAMQNEDAYTLTSAGSVCALDAETGALRWDSKGSIPIGWYAEDAIPRESPVPFDDVVSVVLSTRNEDVDEATVYAFDADEGDERWTYDLDAAVPGVPAAGESSLVVPRSDRTLEAIGSDGERRWIQSLDDDGAIVTVAADTVFVGGIDETVYAIDPDEGTERWRTEFGTTATTTPTLAGERVVVGDSDGALHAIDAADGTREWRIELDTAPTAIAVADDRLLALTGVTRTEWPDESLGWPFSAGVDSARGTLTVHDVADGELVGEYEFEPTDRGGRVYDIASDGDEFYLSRRRNFSRLDLENDDP